MAVDAPAPGALPFRFVRIAVTGWGKQVRRFAKPTDVPRRQRKLGPERRGGVDAGPQG